MAERSHTTERSSITPGEISRILSLLPPQRAGNSPLDHADVLQALWWKVRTKKPWRDIPVEHGKWNSIAARHRRWNKTGVFDAILSKLPEEVGKGENTLPIRVRHIIEKIAALKGRPPRTERKNTKRTGVRSTKHDAKGRWARA